MSRKLSVLVTGATGNTGSLLVPKLLKAGVNVRVFVRDEAKAKSLKDLGAEVIAGNLNEAVTILPAVKNIDKIYLLTWNGETQLQQAENVINAAKYEGVPHIVRHSMWGPENSRIVKQGSKIEEMVKSSGLQWTLLKPTFFMQNTMMAAQTISSDGVVYWGMKDGKLGMIDVRDIVDTAYAVITGAGHEGKSYILTGPEAISFSDVANIFSNVLNRQVKYVNVPGEVLLQSMIGMGMPEWIAKGYVELMEGFSKNFAIDTTKNVEILTGNPARSFEQFAKDFSYLFGSKKIAV